MKYIERSLIPLITQNLKPNKVVVLLGARRTGKSVLIKKIISTFPGKSLFLDGDDFTTLNLFQPRTIENFRLLLGTIKLLVIDEAQQIPEIGKALKLIVDHIPGIQVLITGSSAFDITNKTGEPLTGRKRTLSIGKSPRRD